jgi:hypothetical protein
VGEEAVTTPAARDVLVVLREELVRARDALRVAEAAGPMPDITSAAKKLKVYADALDARIHATFDAVLLEKAAAQFRTAHVALEKLLADRQHQRRASPEVQRILKRVTVHARDVGKMTHASGADHVAAAIESLAQPGAWVGPALDGLVGLVDTFYYLARRRLGDAAMPEQVDSLVDRASSTAVVTCFHALKDLARRARSEPTLMKDRFQLDGALKAASASVVERLAAWFKLDDDGRARLHSAIDTFTRRLLDRATKG